MDNSSNWFEDAMAKAKAARKQKSSKKPSAVESIVAAPEVPEVPQKRPRKTPSFLTHEDARLIAIWLHDRNLDIKDRLIRTHVRKAMTELQLPGQPLLAVIPKTLQIAYDVENTVRIAKAEGEAARIEAEATAKAAAELAEQAAKNAAEEAAKVIETPAAPPAPIGVLERFLASYEAQVANQSRLIDNIGILAQALLSMPRGEARTEPFLTEPVRFITSNGYPPPPPTPRKQRVLLVGANADQLNSVQRVFPFLAVERFHDEHNLSKLPQKAGWADLIIQFTKFSSHGYDRQMGGHKDKLVRINGAASDANRSISLWLSEQAQKSRNSERAEHPPLN
jgi:hypothetical protein